MPPQWTVTQTHERPNAKRSVVRSSIPAAHKPPAFVPQAAIRFLTSTCPVSAAPSVLASIVRWQGGASTDPHTRQNTDTGARTDL